MTKKTIFLYACILVIGIKVVLVFPIQQASKGLEQVNGKFESIKKEIEAISVFQDSMYGNMDFRIKVLDTLSKGTSFRQLQKNQEQELDIKIEEFMATHTDREKSIRRYKTWAAISTFTSIVFVCMAIPTIIWLFKAD